jgi:hypothetical protein
MKGEARMRKKGVREVWMLSLLLVLTAMPALPLVKQAIAATPVKLEVFVPAGEAKIKPAKLAKRLDSLDGKRIAIHWNGKPGAEYLLAEIEDQLKAKYPQATFYQWPKGTAWKSDVEGFIKKQPVDAAILAVGD